MRIGVWGSDVCSSDFLGQIADGLLQRGLEARKITAGMGQQRSCAAVLLVEQSRQQMLWLDAGIVVAHGNALRISQRLLKFSSQFVESHAIGRASGRERVCQYV